MRNLKILGVALVAVLAVSAVAASSAFATYDSHAATTTMKGAQIGENVFNTTSGTVKCKKATFQGTQTGTEIEAGVWTNGEIEVHPTYSECTAFGLSATVNTEGCNYKFTTATTTTTTSPTVTGESHALTHIVCEAGKEIVVKALGCTARVKAQTPTEGLVDFINENHSETNNRSVIVKSTVGGITYTHEGSVCGTGEAANGTYEGEVTVEGRNGAGERVGIWVT